MPTVICESAPDKASTSDAVPSRRNDAMNEPPGSTAYVCDSTDRRVSAAGGVEPALVTTDGPLVAASITTAAVTARRRRDRADAALTVRNGSRSAAR